MKTDAKYISIHETNVKNPTFKINQTNITMAGQAFGLVINA